MSGAIAVVRERRSSAVLVQFNAEGGRRTGSIVRSSVKPSQISDDNSRTELIGRTREVWQPRLARDLNAEDARQIVANIAGFFSILSEWQQAETSIPVGDSGNSIASIGR
jgi:hypothetical protein